MGNYLTCLLLFFFLFVTPLVVTSSGREEDKVRLSLYYETLCPYCADFIVNHLVKLFDDKGLISIVNLRLVPWGNALLQSDGNVVCQHGPNECLLNAIEACTIQLYPDVDKHFRFIYCVERLSLQNNLNQWANCFQMSGLGRTPIDCYTTGNGNVLERNYGTETGRLNPPHSFVPWVVVNDQPLQQDYINFVSYICNAYRGDQPPEACKSLAMEHNSLTKVIPTNQVCYRDLATNLTSPGDLRSTRT